MLDTKKIPFSKIVKSQLPSYVREEFPLIGEFLILNIFTSTISLLKISILLSTVFLINFSKLSSKVALFCTLHFFSKLKVILILSLYSA